jgi:tetratricopeptide (TPR) repeat protein
MKQNIFRNTLVITAFAGVLNVGAQSVTEAISLTESERFERAGSILRGLLQANATDGEAWFYLGENYFENDREDSAAYCYNKGVEVNPRQPLDHVGQGKVFWVKGQRDQAIAKFTEAIAISTDKANKFPKKLQAQTQREVAEGYASGNSPDWVKAMAAVDAAIALDATDPEAYILKGDILWGQNPTDASQPIALYKKASDLRTTSAKPVSRRGLVYHRAKNYDAAIAEYDKAIAIEPGFAPAFRGRAESYFGKREFQKAKADYDEYLKLNSGSQSAMVRYAQFLYLVQDYKQSLDLIGKLQTAGVDNNTLLRIKGYDQVELKDSLNAMPTLDAYFAKQPQEKVIPTDLQYYGRAVALTGNDSLAGEKIMAAAAMPNADPELYMEAGSYFQKAKMFGRAVAAYQAKTNSAKVAVNDWYYLGGAANKAGEYAVADMAWTKYVEKQPNIYQGYLGRARANVGLDPDKQTWQAKPFFEDALRKMKPEEMTKAPKDTEEAMFYLGFYNFYSTKDLPAAKCWFEKVKAVNAGTPNTKVANDMLLSKELKDVAPAACELQ